MRLRTVSTTKCQLGEGAFWHPDRGTFMWFDILGHRLIEAAPDGERHWQFDRYVSAAGVVDATRLLIASSTDLMLFDLESGAQTRLVPLEENTPATRSNDGRADPYGGFWIGTMGTSAEQGAGAFYRFYKGELRKLFDRASIPNATCFSPDGLWAYFTDTAQGVIRRVALDSDGWPKGAAEDWLDVAGLGLHPDGAVIDTEGCMWNAQWGHACVARFAPDGTELERIALPASQITCPAFGGADLATLFVTSAADGLPEEPAAGQCFAVETGARGQLENRVLL